MLSTKKKKIKMKMKRKIIYTANALTAHCKEGVYLKDSRGEGIDAKFLNGVLQIKIPKAGKHWES